MERSLENTQSPGTTVQGRVTAAHKPWEKMAVAAAMVPVDGELEENAAQTIGATAFAELEILCKHRTFSLSDSRLNAAMHGVMIAL